jgi:hypothetical protein
MATITSNTFLDGGVARTAGETWVMDGGVLTVRTDTRVHANAPAAMAGSLGNLTISATLGGGVVLDGRNVRWMAFSSGSGTVPAIGTAITQGGVTGYLLGVWANVTSAPVAPGAAMPATGFIKFREVTGGAFAAGALTGISASADGPDVVGWIEVVMDQSTAITVPRLGFFRTRGDWFELGTTSGAAGQIVQVPTNGGGAGTHAPGLWIETAPASGQYEFYPAVISTFFLAANIATDARGKFVQTLGSGQLRIGNDGTANAGFVPAAGCRIRIPNVIGRQCTTGARASNAAPNATIANRPDFVTTAAGAIDIEHFINDWYHLFSGAFSVKIKHCATFDQHSSANEASPMELENYHCGIHLGTAAPLVLTACAFGGTIIDCKFFRGNAATNGHAVTFTTTFNLTCTRMHFGVIQYARSSGRSLLATQCDGITLNDVFQFNGFTNFTTCLRTRINGIDHCDRLFGSTNTTSSINVITFTAFSDDAIVDGVTFGLKGTISGFHNPASSMFSAAASSNITFRNAGTAAAPLACASNALAPSYIYADGGANNGVKVQRVYLTHTLTGIFLTINTSKNQVFENLVGTTGALQVLSLDTLAKGIRAASNSVSGGASVYGAHVFDMFESNTAGRIWFAMNEPTAFNAAEVTLTLAGASGGFTSGGQVAMPTVGDQLIMDMPYYILGVTALANAAPTLTGTNTGNFTYEYDIDTGAGFSGTYKTLNGANLSGETVSPTTGFRLRLRITTATASTTNALTYVRINTVTTLVAQQAALYPLEVVPATYSLTGLAAGTEVVLFDDENNELDRQVIVGTTYTYSYDWISDIGDVTGVYALIWKDDKYPINFTGITLGATSQSTPVTQADDLVYEASAAVSTFIPASKRQVLDAGVTSVSISKLYSDWKDWLRLGNNAQYEYAYAQLGGNPVSGAVFIPFYAFLLNSWKIRPQEANHTLTIVDGILVASGDPFVNTLGAFIVRINYQQPVQALAVSTSGGGGASAADVRAELEPELALVRANVPLIPAAL